MGIYGRTQGYDGLKRGLHQHNEISLIGWVCLKMIHYLEATSIVCSRDDDEQLDVGVLRYNQVFFADAIATRN